MVQGGKWILSTFIIRRFNSNLTFLQNEVAHINSALNERNTVIGGIYGCGIVHFACFQPLCQLLKQFQNLRVSNYLYFGFHSITFFFSLFNHKMPCSIPELLSVKLWNIHIIFLSYFVTWYCNPTFIHYNFILRFMGNKLVSSD